MRFLNPVIQTSKEFTETPTSLFISKLHENIKDTSEYDTKKSWEMEQRLRMNGAWMIRIAAHLLKVPQRTAATAQVIFMRFYYLQSMHKLGIEDIAMGSMFLSSKLTENVRRVRDIVNVFHLIHNHDFVLNMLFNKDNVPKTISLPLEPILDYISGEYYEWRDRVTFAENVILRELGFHLDVHLPYGLIINYCKILQILDDNTFMTRALSFLNDSFLSPVHVCFQPNVIACSCIWLSLQRSNSNSLFLWLKNNEWCDIFDVETQGNNECYVWIINNIVDMDLSCRMICSILDSPFIMNNDPTGPQILFTSKDFIQALVQQDTSLCKQI